MKHLQLFNVAPRMLPELEFLEILSSNMWWCWNQEAVELFQRMDHDLWKDVGRNPLKLLTRIPQDRLTYLSKDEGFLNHMAEVKKDFDSYMASQGDTDGEEVPRCRTDACYAYFSLEFGIHELFRVYSGGLGILAGDHLKSASDLGLPLVGVGLMYKEGYFQQYLDESGWQQERYVQNELHYMPVKRAREAGGVPLQVSVPLPEGNLKADVWELKVGKVALYLLNTNITDNPHELREITGKLYGGDRQMRLRQELLLGIGGFRALIDMGMEPTVCHINEGHAAFLSLGRLDYLVRHKGLDLAAANEVVARSSVFTTHTPVPAGNEVFHLDLVRPHIEALRRELHIRPDLVYRDGQPPFVDGDELSMTILGLRSSRFANGVSKLHGEVSRKMWAHLWPERPEDEIPIGHVTNAVHAPSWLSAENYALLNKYLGSDWNVFPIHETLEERIAGIPDEELWKAHEMSRARLIRTAREVMQQSLVNRNSGRLALDQADGVLDQTSLTIGFARRFATYKRATLLMRDMDRLEALLRNDDQPVQIVFAGKAHPADEYGKQFIQQIVQFAKREKIRDRIIFLENYNIGLARVMVQGVDVWLNTPRRPREASGTSGMKAAINGVLNVSILDGWWCEGYSEECGWAIGCPEVDGENEEQQDINDSQSLFSILEEEVVPLFYDRPARNYSKKWLAMMKASMAMGITGFNGLRMVSDYHSRAYIPASKAYRELLENDGAKARSLVERRRALEDRWPRIEMEKATADRDISDLHQGDKFVVTVRVRLGDLAPSDVEVQIYHGSVDAHNAVKESRVAAMEMDRQLEEGVYLFRHEITCNATGRLGFTTRVVPRDPQWKNEIPGFMTWPKTSA